MSKDLNIMSKDLAYPPLAILAALVIGMLLLPTANALIYSYQQIGGTVRGGNPGRVYSSTPYAVSVKINEAYLCIPLPLTCGPVGEYYVLVKIFIGGQPRWIGYLAAGGETPTLTANNQKVEVIIKAPFDNSNYGVYFKGVITWIYN